MTIFKNFLKDEDGAVTIDWVALTAGVLLLGIAVVTFIFQNGVDPLIGTISNELAAANTSDVTFDGTAN